VPQEVDTCANLWMFCLRLGFALMREAGTNWSRPPGRMYGLRSPRSPPASGLSDLSCCWCHLGSP